MSYKTRATLNTPTRENTRTTMPSSYVHASVYFPDARLLKRIARIAKAKGVAVGTVLREAAEREVERFERQKGKPSKTRAA